MLFLLVMLSLHLQKCVITLSIDIPDLHLNLRVTTITKQFEMYLQVKSYIINFALIALCHIRGVKNAADDRKT